MLVTKLARVYAKALIDLANERGQLEEVKAEMDKVGQLIKDSRDFDNLLKSPVVKSDKKIAIFNEIFKGQLSEMVLHFAEIIIKHGREEAMAAIAQAYTNMYLTQKGIEKATVTTAYKLSDSEMEELKGRVAEATDSKIELENNVNPDIIGGMVLRVGDRQYNGSIAAELDRLKRDFKHNQYIADF